MTRKIVRSVFALLLFSLVATLAWPKTADSNDLTVHEWGTFTSIAGPAGEPVSWQSYGGSSDLPCFVERFGGFKNFLPGTVRMETPVLYFYGPRDARADVKVAFPGGTITEWYPKAAVSNSTIEWRDVRISPRAEPRLTSDGQSHYYAARHTDAAPLQVGSEGEKFLFYRGVGTFPLPISAKLTEEGNILVKTQAADTVSGVVLFENRGGVRRYSVVGDVRGEMTLQPQILQGKWPDLLTDLEAILADQGLYPKEAHAMVETWSDSWFEEGTRLFYIVPRPAIDSILPLNIQPAPSQIARVFVGRMEILTPAVQDEVRQAVANNDRATLQKYGRFLDPLAKRIGIQSALLDSIHTSLLIAGLNCVR